MELIRNSAAIIGLIGGCLGIYTFCKNLKEKKQDKDVTLFNHNFSYSYIECFENKLWYASEYINLKATYDLAEQIVSFKKRKNKFNSLLTNLAFDEVYGWSIKIIASKGYYGNLMFLENDVVSDSIEDDFNQKKKLFYGLKENYSEFYRLIFNYA